MREIQGVNEKDVEKENRRKDETNEGSDAKISNDHEHFLYPTG